MELQGQVVHVVYRNEKNQYTVLVLIAGEDREEVTVVGTIPMVSEGEELYLTLHLNRMNVVGKENAT